MDGGELPRRNEGIGPTDRARPRRPQRLTGNAVTRAARSLLAAVAVAVAAFLLYDATLLPGQDLGDTASFQATIGDTFLTPRQGYPLYYATGSLFTGLQPKDPARAINLASAVFGAL